MAAETIGLIATYDITEFLSEAAEHSVGTPWGEAHYVLGRLADQPIALLQRYGPGMDMVQHLVNFRANIWGFREIEVRRIIATDGVGSLRRDLVPGTFAVVHDFLDFTQRDRAGPRGRDLLWPPGHCNQLRPRSGAEHGSSRPGEHGGDVLQGSAPAIAGHPARGCRATPLGTPVSMRACGPADGVWSPAGLVPEGDKLDSVLRAYPRAPGGFSEKGYRTPLQLVPIR